jgi:hypothetical protein
MLLVYQQFELPGLAQGGSALRVVEPIGTRVINADGCCRRSDVLRRGAGEGSGWGPRWVHTAEATGWSSATRTGLPVGEPARNQRGSTPRPRSPPLLAARLRRPEASVCHHSED